MKTKLCYSILTIFIIFSIVLCSCSGDDSKTSDDENAIRDCWTLYKDSILDRDGITAITCVSSSTLDYYGEMKDIALTGDESEVKNLSIANMLMVLMLRHLVDPDELATMTSEDLIIYAIDRGWIGEDSVVNSEIGKITISNNRAFAVYLMGGEETSLRYEFVLENDQWKFDLASLIPITNTALRETLEANGINEHEFIFLTLESISGIKVSDDIWQPLVVQ